MKTQPANKTTIIIGDSNYRYVYGELEPEGKSVAVRNVSGLSVVGAAYALKRYEHCYNQIKRWFRVLELTTFSTKTNIV